jgi:uncharacterized protein (TIGR02271 family)
MTEHIVAVFKSEAAAAAAEQSLENIGIPRSVIRRYAAAGASPSEVVPAGYVETHTIEGGFWSWLFGEDETTRFGYTHDAYERSAAAGHVVVAASVDDSKIHEAITALEAHDPLGIDEGSDEVSESTTASSLAPLPGASTTGQDFSTSETVQAGSIGGTVPSGRIDPPATPAAPVTTSETFAPPSGAELPAAAAPPTATTSTADTVGMAKGEQVIPLAEEQLEIGKRTVDRGTTRIRRYVVEKPVEESLNLRTERVTIERRQPIEGAAPGGGAFEERVVEVRETAEEPVVAKTAHVVEEVVVGREATERTETVKDTVRREDVEVSKDGEVKP